MCMAKINQSIAKERPDYYYLSLLIIMFIFIVLISQSPRLDLVGIFQSQPFYFEIFRPCLRKLRFFSFQITLQCNLLVIRSLILPSEVLQCSLQYTQNLSK
jgi:hypothetical protein